MTKSNALSLSLSHSLSSVAPHIQPSVRDERASDRMTICIDVTDRSRTVPVPAPNHVEYIPNQKKMKSKLSLSSSLQRYKIIVVFIRAHPYHYLYQCMSRMISMHWNENAAFFLFVCHSNALWNINMQRQIKSDYKSRNFNCLCEQNARNSKFPHSIEFAWNICIGSMCVCVLVHANNYA